MFLLMIMLFSENVKIKHTFKVLLNQTYVAYYFPQLVYSGLPGFTTCQLIFEIWLLYLWNTQLSKV